MKMIFLSVVAVWFRNTLKCCLLFLLLPVAVHAQTNPYTLNAESEYIAFGKKTRFYFESAETLDIYHIRQRFAEGVFQPSQQSIPGYSLGAPPMWLKFDVANNSKRDILRHIIIEIPWLDFIDIYFVRGNVIADLYQGGDFRRTGQKTETQRVFSVEHVFPPGITEVYMRVKTDEPLLLPMSFVSHKAAEQLAIRDAYHYGVLYGVITSLLLFNLLIYLSIRQKRYLYYVVYLLMYLYMDFSYTGHGFSYLWQDMIQFQKWSTTFSISFYSTAGILFALAFLQVKKAMPALYRKTIIFIASLLLIQLFLYAINLHTWSIVISLVYVSVFSLFTLWLAFARYKKGHTDAVYYIVATIGTLFGAAITAMSVVLLVPYNYFTFHAGEITVAADAILLSIALAEQIRRAQNEKLQAQIQARTDTLTHLNNRLAFEQDSKAIWSRVTEDASRLCFILFDIDYFKNINDKYGHANGDKVLKAISSTVSSILRDNDNLVRWGGEEFAILLQNLDLHQAENLAERIRRRIAAMPIELDGDTVNVTVSLGVAEKDATCQNIDDLFKAADKKLYQAKQKGRNQVCS